MTNVVLRPLEENDRQQFILDNQRAFKYGACEEFGMRDNHFEEDDEIISRATIESCIDGENRESYRIFADGEIAGGCILHIDPISHHNELEILFTLPEAHSKGIGKAAWKKIEELHPETEVWECVTPYFETRNIHFYVNCLDFHIVEFYNERHPEPFDPEEETEENMPDMDEQFPDGMFRFEKVMHPSED